MTADTITAIKKAFPNMFRPLEWHHFDGKTEHGHGEWWAHSSRGMFHIYDVREKFPNDRPFYAKELSDQLDTLEMAQEAFQKRHEMDIVMCLDPGFVSTIESLQRENKELKNKLSGCDWYWPEDDTSSDACANSPWEIAEIYDLKPANVLSYSRGGVVETRHFAFLPAADDSDSDDNFEVDEATEEEVVAKITAEMERRAALSSTGDTHAE